MGETKPKVLSIVGATSSGKTSLSIILAKQFSGEVISADSRQVYTGLDLASGKVTTEEMEDVPHHLLDVANPMTVYTASDFAHDAAKAISDVSKRNKLPIIAGGTFFYVDMLLGKISSPEVPPNETLRKELEQLSSEELYQRLTETDPERAAVMDPQNPRRLVRALEIVAALGKVPPLTSTEKYDVLTLGIDIPKEELHNNIHIRLQQRFDEGMLDEIKGLMKQGLTHERLEALGLECRYVSRHLRGELSYEEMLQQLETKIRQFAKRQLTWLKRDTSIVWVDKNDTQHIFSTVDQWLSN